MCVKSISGIDAELVLDPTLLLNKEDWQDHLSPKSSISPYILTYFEDENGVVRETALTLSRKTGFPVYNITNGKSMHGVNNISLFKLEDFISYIYNSEIIVTSSYHGMAFSINFNKQFYYFNRCHKSRMDSLAEIAGVQNRELLKDKDFDDNMIDYSCVNDRINKWRGLSFKYLDKVFEV